MEPSQSPPLLRSRRGLLFTAFPAIAVLAVLGALLAVAHHRSVVEDRHNETRALAATAAADASRYIQNRTETLSAVASAPEVRLQRRRLVNPYLRTVAKSARFTSGMGLVDRHGMLIASTLRVPPGKISFADRPYVQAGLEEGRPAVSDVILGRFHGRPVLATSYPTSDARGRRNGVVIGSVRLDKASTELLNRQRYTEGGVEMVLDSKNHVIVGPGPVTRIHGPPASYPIARMRATGHGLIDAVDTPRGKRLLSYATVAGPGWLAIVDQDYGAVIAPLDRALWGEIVALALLAALGVLATLAGARRLDRLGEARESELVEQRDIALRLQRSLLPDVPAPDRLQVHAAYAPAQGAMAIGGDWYDAVELPDGRFALSVGDVAGHGLAAASVMGQLRSAARTLALDSTSPADVLQRLDRFASMIAGRPLATVVYALVDPVTGLLRYALAGHPPPVLVRADGASELLQEGRSPLLGVDPVGPRAEGEATLRPGDTLIFYTDGLIERPDSSIDAGIQWLAQRASTLAALEPQALADALIAEVAEPRRDDTAVLCVRLAPVQSRVAS